MADKNRQISSNGALQHVNRDVAPKPLEKRQHFLPKWIQRRLMRNARLYDTYYYWTQVRRLLSYVGDQRNFFKTPQTSLNIYQAKGDYEHKLQESGTTLCLWKGHIHRLTHAKVRDLYCEYLFAEIDALLSEKPKLQVMEVGCGNCINLVLLKEKYGEKLEITGYDISERRIAVAQDYFKQQLDGVKFKVQSATEPVQAAEENQYDFVFSMHCIEQIPFGVLQAVEGMYKRTRRRVVLIEPVFEFARPAQKIFLIYSDFVRTLLPTVQYLGYKILKAKPLDIESSLKNQSSIIVIDKLRNRSL